MLLPLLAVAGSAMPLAPLVGRMSAAARAEATELAVSVAGAIGLRTFVLDSRYVPSASMEPTLLVGDMLLLEKVSFRFSRPARGEVVCFRPPPALAEGTPQGACYIKRVVAVGGDVVRVRDGELLVNGRSPPESRVPVRVGYRLAPTRVPEGHVFVLGDNRNHSYDSHVWGALKCDLLIGRPLCRYWPPRRARGRAAFRADRHSLRPAPT